ncbi:MAG: SDR family oxidoreductase [Anaerolineae bacterium]
MKVLYIGGTGIISSACAQLSVERGVELYLLNRGKTTRPVPKGAHVLLGDIRDPESVERALAAHQFDTVVDWIAFTPEQVQADIDLFRGRTEQYIFISSASAYQKPPANLPVTESTPLDNPYWAYSRNKIACEELLVHAYRAGKFPATIVRPSHTYDRTLLPCHGGYTIIDRMRKGKKVIVHGDGTSLWVLTHHKDFAKGLVGLQGNIHAIGDVFQIMSDEWLTWNQIFHILGHAAGVEPRLIHIPSEFIAAFDPEWGAGLLGDKAHSMIFDSTKIKRLVPDFVATHSFTQGAREIIDWYNAEPARQIVSEEVNAMHDRIINAYEARWPDK